MNNYKFGFDIWGLLLFLLIMVPNLIWFVYPASNDILRGDSTTPIIDTIGSVCQVIFIAALCILKRKDIEKIKISLYIINMIVMVVLYYIGWITYYCGVTNSLIILLLTIPPCAAFVFYSIDRKNIIALIPLIGFTCCHIVYGVVNYII